MKVRQKSYQKNTIRYLELPENDLLLNTKDVLAALGVADRPQGSVLAEPCIDLASAMTAALGTDAALAEWLIEEFGGYKKETLVHPQCGDDWIFD